MATTVIDALVVSLGFDTSGLTKGANDADKAFEGVKAKAKETSESVEKDTDAAENVEELVRSALRFDEDAEASGSSGLSDYLLQTALISDVDSFNEASGAVSLMTLHSAKGLEFPC